jgi:hypothetical protein
MGVENCGTCLAANTWCWMFTVNEEAKEGICPCAHCDKNPDCDIVYPEADNGYIQCDKFHRAWPEEE